MSIPVLSKTLEELYNELGFGKDKGRDSNILRSLLASLPKDTLIGKSRNRGSRPLFKADSSEAKALAENLCVVRKYGEQFWLNHTHSDWPCWPADKERILYLVAHLISRLAFLQYQKEGKAKTKAKNKPKNTEIVQLASSGLPLSREVDPTTLRVANVPKKPLPNYKACASTAPYSTSIVTTSRQYEPKMASTPPAAPKYDQYIRFIKLLDPVNEEPLGYHFTHAWIKNESAKWPEAVDYRIWKHMIYADYYFPRKEDIRGHSLTSLQKRLTRGTSLEGCSTSSEAFITFDKRLYSRIHTLSHALENKDIINLEAPGKWSKTSTFDAVWTEHIRNGNKFWTMKRPVTEATRFSDHPGRIRNQILRQDVEQASENVFEPLSIASAFDNDDYIVVQIAETQNNFPNRLHKQKFSTKELAKHSHSTVSKLPKVKDMNTKRSLGEFGGRKKGEVVISDDILSRKRQKIIHRRTPPDASNIPPYLADNGDEVRILPTTPKEASPVPPRTEAQELPPSRLTPTPISPLDQSPQNQPQPAPNASCTDMSSMMAVRNPNNNLISSDDCRNIQHSRFTAPLTPPENPEIPALGSTVFALEERTCGISQLVMTTKGTSESPPNPAKTPAPKREMFLTFFQDKRPNLRDFIPFSTLDLSLNEFFNFYSGRTGTPLDDLEFLTFRTPWVGYRRQQAVWRDGSEEDWRTEVDDIRRLYKITRLEKPNITDFEIWVQPGYDRSLTPDGDDMDLSRL